MGGIYDARSTVRSFKFCLLFSTIYRERARGHFVFAKFRVQLTGDPRSTLRRYPRRGGEFSGIRESFGGPGLPYLRALTRSLAPIPKRNPAGPYTVAFTRRFTPSRGSPLVPGYAGVVTRYYTKRADTRVCPSLPWYVLRLFVKIKSS